MQSQLVFNGIHPRPRIYSTAVFRGAAEAFLASNELYTALPDFTAADEEWLRKTFVSSVTSATSTDPWPMAASFAGEIGDRVNEDYVELFEKFAVHLGQWQEQALRYWIASGGAANPLMGEVHRVEVDTKDGVSSGIAFNDPRYAEVGKFMFLQDGERQNSISHEGEVTRTYILEWETIKAVAKPTEDDLAIHAANQAIRAAREERTRTQQLWRNAERQRDALLSSNKVSDCEANDIFAALGLEDEVSAARAANAILAVLARRKLEQAS